MQFQALLKFTDSYRSNDLFYFAAGPKKKCATQDTRLTMIDPNKAPHGICTTNPIPNNPQIQDENHNKKALMISMNRPRVRTISPQDRNLRIGRMNILTNPSTTAITAKAR